MSLFSVGQQLGQMAANKGLQMAKKPSGGVRRRNETRDQFRGRMDNISSAIDAVFRGVQQTRTKVHKGLSGMQLNPDGTDPGNSFDRFMRQNPHLGGAAQRQAQYDQQARGNMASAVAERKALQDIQASTPSSKSVVGADGYRSIFDSSGNAVGTTAPVGNGQSMVFDDALGQMVPMSAWSQRKDYVQGTKGMGPTPMQQAANRSVSKLSGMDQIFGGGAKQPSPSSVAGGGVVEPPQPKGALGGELFGMPQWVLDQELKSSLPADSLRNGQQQRPQYTPMQPNDRPQHTPMMPNDGPQQSATLYPFQYGNMARPAYGTLAEKESARRKALTGSKGAVGSYGQWIEDKTTSMENTVQDMLRSIFGDPTLQTTNQAMQDPMQQQLNLGSAIPWLANLVPMAQPKPTAPQPKPTAPQPINEVEALNQLEQLLRKSTKASRPSISFSEFLSSMMQGNPNLSF